MYLIALVCPPLAILLCGKPFQAMLAVPFSLFYFPGALWAILVVSDHKAWQRTRALGAAFGPPVALVQQVNVTQITNVRVEPTNPAPARVPSPREADVMLIPIAPRSPLITLAQVRAGLALGKAGVALAGTSALSAYRNLPEWAQPITWGLAAASPVALIIAILFVSR